MNDQTLYREATDDDEAWHTLEVVPVEPVGEFEVTTYRSLGTTIEIAGLPFYVNMDQEVGIDDIASGRYAIVKMVTDDE